MHRLKSRRQPREQPVRSGSRTKSRRMSRGISSFQRWGTGLKLKPTVGTLTTDLATSNILFRISEGIRGEGVEFSSTHNNFYVRSTLPQSDYNYSWISSSLGSNYSVRSGTQKVFGYWPKNGTNKVNGVFDSAITFPTASEIQGR